MWLKSIGDKGGPRWSHFYWRTAHHLGAKDVSDYAAYEVDNKH